MLDWEEKVSSFLLEAARERNWDLTALSKEERRELLWDLKQRGAFAEKRAADFIAGLMHVSTETVSGSIQSS